MQPRSAANFERRTNGVISGFFRAGSRRWTWRELAVVGMMIIMWRLQPAEGQGCAVGLKTHGYTWPRGDIILEYGQELKVLCILNQTSIDLEYPGKNISDVFFEIDHKEVDPEFVSVVNETAIQLTVSKPPPSNSMSYCKLRTSGGRGGGSSTPICLNNVVVGFKPREPKNFTCVSHNWENMTCSWEPPENYVTTKYTVRFKITAGKANSRKVYPCPNDNPSPNVCFWDKSTDPLYRQIYDNYTFYLIGENVLGKWNGTYKIRHYSHVIPARPQDLTVVNKTLTSVLLHWKVPFPMGQFPVGLHSRVAFQSQFDPEEDWKVIDLVNDIHNARPYYNLTELRYANAVYDVRVYLKSAQATREDRWSQYSVVTFRTPSTVPGVPPKVDVGSFEVTENNGNRDIILHWQTIPSYLENGDNFHYYVVMVDENGLAKNVMPSDYRRTYAVYRGINPLSNYTFEIYSANAVGLQNQASRIFVPSKNEIPKEPLAFTKIAFEDGLYELSWKPPEDEARIVSYTIYWCDNDRDRPYTCLGFLDWIHVPGDTTVYNMTTPMANKVYQFAISANTEHHSSGMMWASCTVIHNMVVGKMKTVWINRIGSSSIEVGWKLDCSDRIGIIEGYRIYYCPIMSPYNRNCKGPKLNTTIPADDGTIRGHVMSLVPYTTYMIEVAVLTKNGEGQRSDPLYNTTLEAAPSTPPINVKVSNITNTTIFVSWEEPEKLNGVLRYYAVTFDGMMKKVEEVNHYELKGLAPYSNYSIRIQACTVECSELSETLFVRTEIGTPEKVLAPNVRFINSSLVKVVWIKPQRPAGPLNYYQVKGFNGEIQNTTKEYAQLSIPDCTTVGREIPYQFSVRAVNIDSYQRHIFGPWSESGEGNCYKGGPSYKVWIMFWVIGSITGIAFVFCLAYSSRRMWNRCKTMSDVDMKLPPGLAPNMKLLQKTSDQHTRQSSTDSSGCSSAQESVTSSLTSDSHVSTDSGAEVDPAGLGTGNQKKLLVEGLPTWESSRLRQRNVAGITKPCIGTAANWDPYGPKTSESDAMSVVRSTPNLSDIGGYNVSQQTWSSTGYISMPSSEEMSNNSSPVPKENQMNVNYKLMGIISEIPADKEVFRDEPQLNSTIPMVEPSKPYVTLMSLEQKARDRRALAIDSHIRDLEDLEFIEQHQPEHFNNIFLKQAFHESPTLTEISSMYDTESLVDDFSDKMPKIDQPQVFGELGGFGEHLKKTQLVSGHVQDNSHKNCMQVEPIIEGEIKINSAFQIIPPGGQINSSSPTSEGKFTSLYPSLDMELSKEDLSLGSSSNSSSVSSSPTTFTLAWQPNELNGDLNSSNNKVTNCFRPATGYVTLPADKVAHFGDQGFVKSPNGLPTNEEKYKKVSIIPSAVH